MGSSLAEDHQSGSGRDHYLTSTNEEGAPIRHDDDDGQRAAVHQDSLTQTLQSHAREHWPQLTDLQVRFRGQFACVDGATADDEQPLPLCRLRFLGSAATRGSGLYLASSDKNEDQILPTGSVSGTDTDALDRVCGLCLAGPDLGDCPPAPPRT